MLCSFAFFLPNIISLSKNFFFVFFFFFFFFFFFTTDSTTVFHSVKETFHALSAGIGDAYACPSAPAINLTAKKSSAEVTLTRFKFQPFGVKSGHFGNGRNYFFLCFVLTGNYVISIS